MNRKLIALATAVVMAVAAMTSSVFATEETEGAAETSLGASSIGTGTIGDISTEEVDLEQQRIILRRENEFRENLEKAAQMESLPVNSSSRRASGSKTLTVASDLGDVLMELNATAVRSSAAETYSLVTVYQSSEEIRQAIVNSTGSLEAGWDEDSNGWRYKENGEWVTGLFEAGTEYYYFGSDTYMVHGWQEIDSTCEMSDGEPITVLEYGWYYFGVPGDEDTGTLYFYGWLRDTEAAGAWYYLDPLENGKMRHGFLSDDGELYYLGIPGDPNSGAMYTYGWLRDTEETGSPWYYFNDDGTMHTGFLELDDETYYMDPDDGSMHTGILSAQGNTYYMDENSGAMYTGGWKLVSGYYYYFAPTGRAYTGTHTIGEYSYSFSAIGRLLIESVANDVNCVRGIASGMSYRFVDGNYRCLTPIGNSTNGVLSQTTSSNDLQEIKINYQGNGLYILQVVNASTPNTVLTRSDGMVVTAEYRDKANQLWEIVYDEFYMHYYIQTPNDTTERMYGAASTSGTVRYGALTSSAINQFGWHVEICGTVDAAYFYTAEPRYFIDHDPVESSDLYTERSAVIDSINSHIQNMSYDVIRYDNPYAADIHSVLPELSVAVLHGHGNPGALYCYNDPEWYQVLDDEGNLKYAVRYNDTTLLYASKSLSAGSRYRTLKDYSSYELNACQLMTFISCYSARSNASVEGASALSMIEAAYECGAQTVIGFYNTVAGGEYYFDLVFASLTSGNLLSEALMYADANYTGVSILEPSAPHNSENQETVGSLNKRIKFY